MAYNLELEELLKLRLSKTKGLISKNMFGGMGFLINGNMALGIHKDELMVRVDPEKHEMYRAKPNAIDFYLARSGSSKGWLLVVPKGWKNEKELDFWVNAGMGFASSLPKKVGAGMKKKVVGKKK